MGPENEKPSAARVAFLPFSFLFEDFVKGAKTLVTGGRDVAALDCLNDGAALLFGVTALGVAAGPAFQVGNKLAESVGQVVLGKKIKSLKIEERKAGCIGKIAAIRIA